MTASAPVRTLRQAQDRLRQAQHERAWICCYWVLPGCGLLQARHKRTV